MVAINVVFWSWTSLPPHQVRVIDDKHAAKGAINAVKLSDIAASTRCPGGAAANSSRTD